MSSLDQLYQDVLLEHNQSPRNFGKLEGATIQEEGFNPLCGDRVVLRVHANNSLLDSVRFEGEGCAICMASASIMTECVQGCSASEISAKVQSFRDLMQGNDVNAKIFEDTDVQALIGVRRYPVRIKCALLPWVTMKCVLAKMNTVRCDVKECQEKTCPHHGESRRSKSS